MAATIKAEDPLYFIAIIPPEPIASTITALKQEMAAEYQAKAALRSPPHITLHMPFRWPKKKAAKLQTALNSFAANHTPVNVSLDGFGAFPPRVLFVAVAPNEGLENLQCSLLKNIRRELHILNGNYKQRGFHPHITIAFRDLKPSKFQLAWEALQNKPFESHFTTSHITLLKHNGKLWEVFTQFELGNQTT